MGDSGDGWCVMGVDVGKRIHVVVLRELDDFKTFRLVHLAELSEFGELDPLMERFKVDHCVIDGQPEPHPAREFARRHPSKVNLCFFSETQHGSARWDPSEMIVSVNRTEALDASRAALRERKLVLPRREARLEQFARHNAAVYKKLEEKASGGLIYRYDHHGEDHYAMAFTYAWMAASRQDSFRAWMAYFKRQRDRLNQGR